MSSTKDSATPSTASSDRLIGRVKWFNNKAGYGFITVTDGSRSGSDVFVHHSTIGVASQQYKYLVQGEYVDFELSVTQGGTHEFQATNVVGIKGGKLMCETRHEYKIARSAYKSLADEPNVEGFEPKVEVFEPKVYVIEPKVKGFEPKVKGFEPKVKGFEPKTPRQKSVPKNTDGEKKDWTFVSRKNSSEKPSSKYTRS